MKKVILLTLLILPVVIVLLTFAIANSVGREIMFIDLERVELKDRAGFIQEGYSVRVESDENPQYELWADRYTGRLGERNSKPYELGKFFNVVPSKAKITDLKFESSNPDAVDVIGGKIYIFQKTRTSDGGEVTVKASFGGTVYFTVYVDTELIIDDERFDYFGFDYELLRRGLIGSEYADWIKEGERELKISAIAGEQIPLSAILYNGIDTSPHDLLYSSGNPYLEAFLGSLDFTSNSSILTVTKDGTDFVADITGEGNVQITITTNFRGKNYSIFVSVVLTLNE